MGTFTVKAVGGTNDNNFIGRDGLPVELTEYQLELADPSGDTGFVVLSQKRGTPPPQPGETLDGDVVGEVKGGPFKGSLRFKKEYAGGSFGSAGNGGGASSFGGGQRQPAQQAAQPNAREERIEKMWAWKVAASLGASNVDDLEQKANAVLTRFNNPGGETDPGGTPVDTSSFGEKAEDKAEDIPF